MQQWIAKRGRAISRLVGRLARGLQQSVDDGGFLDGIPCVLITSRDQLRVLVRQLSFPCSHSNFAIEMQVRDESHESWLPIALLRDSDLAATIDLLRDVEDSLDSLQSLECLERD